LKARFAALRSYTLVDAFTKPDVCSDVPRVEKDFEVWGEFHPRDIDVCNVIPDTVSICVVATETKACKDACSLTTWISELFSL
jgi:hypothetical protein